MPSMKTAGRAQRLLALALAAVLAAAPLTASAQQPPVSIQSDDAEAREAERERLFAALAEAPDVMEARQHASEIWLFWFQAPDAEAAELMNEALDRRRMADYAHALAVLDLLVEQAPDWAEAWNQRATIRFLVGDFEGSLADIDRVLPLEPKHFGALAGQALILMRLGRDDEAQTVLRQAVEINPFLAERAFLREDEGEDI